jgi:hypothetical protein
MLLRTLVRVACLAALALATTLHAASEFRDAVEFTARNGLPNTFSKLEKGGPVKIAYLGGSITAQKGWRVQSRAWLQQQFPKAQISEIDAAIGGTGSELGVFRVEADALADKPDLLFVEFAVNDSSSSHDSIRNAMEGIVRKTWRLLPDTDICFVYTATANDTKALAAGKMRRPESAMEQVADHYGIPSIHFGLEVARLEQAGKLVMKSTDALMTRVSGDELNESAALATDPEGRIIFSKDGVHPYPETGHVLYTQALIRSFEKMRTLGQPAPHSLIAPLSPENWENAKKNTVNPATDLSGPTVKLNPATDPVARKFNETFTSLFKLEPGATLHVKFRGTKISIYDVIGPDGAKLQITIDGESKTIDRFDRYCSYHRLNSLKVAEDLPDAIHEVSITVLSEAPDKRALLSPQNQDILKKRPENFAATSWYPGAIFIVGDIVR